MKTRTAFGLGCLTGGLAAPVALFLIFLVIAIVFKDQIVAMRSKQLETPRAVSGLDADYGWSIFDLEGNAVALDTWKDKALFLHFWHPECYECLPELPGIAALYAQSKDAAQFMLVGTGEAEDIRTEAAKYGLEGVAFRLEGELPPVFASTSVPRTYIIAPGGEIVLRHVGSANWGAPELEALVKAAGALGPK